jgi:hypothetical protein
MVLRGVVDWLQSCYLLRGSQAQTSIFTKQPLGSMLAQRSSIRDRHMFGVCRFELVAPPRFGLVCLRLRGADNEGNKELLAAVNSAGGRGEGGVSMSMHHIILVAMYWIS